MPEHTQRSGSPRSRSRRPPGSGQPPAGRARAGRPRIDPARRAAYDVLRAVADRDAYANLLLPALLTERGLTGRDAAFATELTYGTLRGRGTYDAILAACSDRDELDPPVRDVLRLGAHQLLATRVGSHAAVATSVDLAKDVCGPRPSGFVNAVLRRVATRDLDAWIQVVAPDRSRDPSGYLAVRHSYPRWIIDAFRDALGPVGAAETEDALAAGNVRPEVVLALSPAPDGLPPSSDATGLLPDGEWTRWSPYGYRLAGGNPAPLVASGQAAVQDEASQLAALALTRIGLDPLDPLDRRGRALARPMRGPRRQGPAAERPRRRPRCPPGRLGHPPAPGAARRSKPCAARAARPQASWSRTGARCRGRRARSTASWPTSRVPASGRCAAVPKPGGAKPPPMWPNWPPCSASCSTRPSTRSGPAAWWPT